MSTKPAMNPMLLFAMTLLLMAATLAAGLLPFDEPQAALPEADPAPVADPAEETLNDFFYFWYTGNHDEMLALTAPSWRNAQERPEVELHVILANRMPEIDYEIISISGSEADALRTVRVNASINRNNGKAPIRYAFQVVMVREEGRWYVDPRSLLDYQQMSAPTPNPTPTQPVPQTATPETVLYYNPDGGSRYHLDPNCATLAVRYRPMQGQFLYSQVSDEPYSGLKPCSYCAAPIRQD